jgi:hypothetical protein|tara:strand:+ start:64 stop:420 length:357 start_codon:yes stop_codon:yes gene_type:complete
MSRYQLVQIDGRTTYHHIGSSSSKSGYSWIQELRIATGRDTLQCAGFRCTQPATLGAHLKPKSWQEWLRVFSLGAIGGVPVVPCCNACHNTSGGEFRIKATYAIIDPGAVSDNFGFKR